MRIATPHSRPRWFQFSLRTLLLVMLLAGLVAAWVRYQLPAREERDSIARLQENSEVQISYEHTPRRWWQFAQPFDSDRRVVAVTVWMAHDADLEQIGKLRYLRQLTIERPHALSDDGLKHLRSLALLEELEFHGHPKGTTGLCHLRELRHLKSLQFFGLTDDGAKELVGLPNLEALDLAYSPITDRGLAHLQRLPNLKAMSLHHCYCISDAGIAALRTLRLHELCLLCTKLTDASLAHLREIAPLEIIGLADKMTNTGIQLFQQARPDVIVSDHRGVAFRTKFYIFIKGPE